MALSRRGLKNPEEVGRAAKYKCEHWMDRAEAAMAEGTSLAKKAAAAGGQAERVLAHWEAAAKFAKAEACIEESIRQFTKQSDRLIINKLAAMRAAGIAERSGVNIKAFLEKVALLKQSGLERFGGRGLSTAEVEVVLRDKYSTTLRQLYADLEKLTVDLDEAIGLAQAAGKGAAYTTDDIVESVIGGIVGHTDDEE